MSGQTPETIATMLEMIIVSLLIWLWVIERRLNNLRKFVQSIKLDAQGMQQSTKYLIDSEIANFRAELGDLLGTPEHHNKDNGIH